MKDVAVLTRPTLRPTDEELRPGLLDVSRWLVERWKTIAAAMAIGAAIAYLGSALIPPQYEATASLFVDSRSIQPLATPPGQSPSTDNNSEVSFVESQAKIITSQRVLSRVVEDQRLASDPEFSGTAAPSVVANLQHLFNIRPPASSDESRDREARAALAARLTVRRPERTFILDVSVRARSPDESAILANAVAQAYLGDQEAAHAEMARRANGTLTGRLDELRKRLQDAETRVQAFKDQHGLIGTRQQLSSEQQLTEANAQLAQARAQRIRTWAQLDRISSGSTDAAPENGTPEATASATISLLRGKQADAKRQLASMLAQFGPRYPSVRDARDQLADVDRSIQTELKRIRQAVQIEYQRATDSEKNARAVVDRLSAGAADTSSALSQLAQMQQEVDIDKNLLNTFISRAQETGEMERMNSGQTRVISRAEPPLRRMSPPRGIVFVVMGSALGFWLASAWVVVGRLGPISALRRRRLSGPERPSDRPAAVF